MSTEYRSPDKRLRSGRPRTLLAEPGDRFGRLVFIAETRSAPTPGRPGGRRLAVCQCDCGAWVEIMLVNVVRGHAQSCGCRNRELAAERMRQVELASRPGRSEQAKMSWVGDDARRSAMSEQFRIHGLSGHPLFQMWCSMIARCEDPTATGYKNWGGRGIKVCDRWHDPAAFIEDIERELGPRPDDVYANGYPVYTLDRIDNDGDYEPGNVRWATKAEQAANRRPARLLAQGHL